MRSAAPSIPEKRANDGRAAPRRGWLEGFVRRRRRPREVVHGVSFSVSSGETLALVGESGSGKTATALSIVGLLPSGAGRGGSIRFEGREIADLAEAELRRLRGERIGMVFQEPMTSLNPVLTIGQQLTEGPIAHGRVTPAGARELAVSMLERVRIKNARSCLAQYPHELSGGMRQRVMIATAMAMQPRLLIADEPTTALDVTVQAQILDLMRALTSDSGTSLVLITHDMGVVAEMADRVVVMREGRVVEEATASTLFAAPARPYTRALLAAVPRIGDGAGASAAKIEIAHPILAVERVSKTFWTGSLLAARHGTRALDDVSLSVMAGETVALVGESGSGKSTLGRAAARLVDIDDGAILLDGDDLRRMSSSGFETGAVQDPIGVPGPVFLARPALHHRAHGGRTDRHSSSRLSSRCDRAG